MSKLRTWYVSYHGHWELPDSQKRKKFKEPVFVPVVTATTEPSLYAFKVRALTGRAAARKYIRCNLAHDMACRELETTNICSPTYMTRPTREEIKRLGSDCAKRARIVVVRQGAGEERR